MIFPISHYCNLCKIEKTLSNITLTLGIKVWFSKKEDWLREIMDINTILVYFELSLTLREV